MVDLGMYEFKNSNTGNIIPKQSFINVYADKINETEQVRTSTKQLSVILDDKYKKEDLNKVIQNQCKHLTETQHNERLKILQKENMFSMEDLVPGKQIQ